MHEIEKYQKLYLRIINFYFEREGDRDFFLIKDISMYMHFCDFMY